jgi:single-strand DNA-binding protein
MTVNKVFLVGSLGRDAETRTAGSSTVTAFNLATEYSYKKGNDWVKTTDWHNVVVWAASDFLQRALHKGAKVHVEGRISYEEYEKDGNKKKITKIVAEKVTPLDRQEKGSRSDNQDSNDDMPF